MEKEKCKVCNGDGFTAEHDSGYGSHDENGMCSGSCPVQTQCENCQATGYVTQPPNE